MYKIRWKQAFLTVFEGPPDERKRSRHNNVILQVQRGKKIYKNLLEKDPTSLLIYLPWVT